MKKHIFLDQLTIMVASIIAGKKKFFAESLQSPSFDELVHDIHLNIPLIDSKCTIELVAQTPVGNMDAALRVEKWLGVQHPTIIYHHGNNERPFDYRRVAKNTFFNLFVNAKHEFDTNIIVIRAPYHNCSLGQYQQQMTNLSCFMGMLSVSIKLNQLLIHQMNQKSDAPIITIGTSLGGWVTNLHRSIYNSSTAYIPIMAGTMLGELFIQSKYNKLTSPNALQFPDTIREKLNFNVAFDSIQSNNVFPLLARWDQFIEFDVQKKSYNGYPCNTMEKGHVTGALNTLKIRTHIQNVLKQLPQLNPINSK